MIGRIMPLLRSIFKLSCLPSVVNTIIIIVNQVNEGTMAKTYFELAGGKQVMYKLAESFYQRVFADPIMVPLFRDPDEDHVGRMALWLGEFFGGPSEHTAQRGGFYTVVDVHRDLGISDTQRQHWIEHMLAACDEVGLSAEVMAFFTPHIHFGARAAQNHSRF
jgi:truncated hemoglobin YjbI